MIPCPPREASKFRSSPGLNRLGHLKLDAEGRPTQLLLRHDPGLQTARRGKSPLKEAVSRRGNLVVADDGLLVIGGDER